MVIGLVAVGLTCFCAFVLLFAFGGGPNARDGGAHAASRSAVGYAGVVQLLQDLGTPVSTSRGTRLDEGAGSGLLVLTPRPGHAAPSLARLLASGRTVLLVLPKWQTEALAAQPGWVTVSGLLPTGIAAASLPALLPYASVSREAGTMAGPLVAQAGYAGASDPGPIERLQVFHWPHVAPLLSAPDGAPVLGGIGDGLYILSDPDLLNNAGIADPANARVAATMLQTLAEGGPITFDLSLDGFGRSRDPLRAVFEPPLLGATLCAAAASLLAVLLGAGRFGPAQPPRRALAFGKAALAGNSAALIARAGREARMAAPYGALTRQLAARALGLPRGLGPAETVDALDRDRPAGAPSLASLLAATEGVRNQTGLLTAARALYQWRWERTRARQ